MSGYAFSVLRLNDVMSNMCKSANLSDSALLFLLITLCVFCTPPIRQYYFDTYHSEDNVYENKPLGFCITYRGNWNIITDPQQMNPAYRAFARSMQNAGGELLYMGSTVEGLYGTRALAINLNEPPEEYASYIRDINADEIDHDSLQIAFNTRHIHTVKWIYDKSGYRFAEFFFVIDTYDIRISFWSKPALFDNFLSVFEEMIGTIEFTAGL